MDVVKLIEEIRLAGEAFAVLPNAYYGDLFKRAADALESLQIEMTFTRQFIFDQGLAYALLSEYDKHNHDSSSFLSDNDQSE